MKKKCPSFWRCILLLFPGGESILREFKSLGRNHGGLNDPVKRLAAVMKRHHLNVFPKTQNENLKPKSKTRGPYKKKPEKNIWYYTQTWKIILIDLCNGKVYCTRFFFLRNISKSPVVKISFIHEHEKRTKFSHAILSIYVSTNFLQENLL